MKTKRDCDIEMAIDSGCEVDNGPSRIYDKLTPATTTVRVASHDAQSED